MIKCITLALLFTSYAMNAYKLYCAAEFGQVEIVLTCGVIFFPLGVAMGVL